MDGGVSEVSFSCEFFFLSPTLLQVQFDSLSFDLHKAQMLRPESVNVSDNSWIP